MIKRTLFSLCIAVCAFSSVLHSEEPAKERPDKIYVPYEKLKDVFEKEGQGVFMPYGDFMALWKKAHGEPAGVGRSPFPYLTSTARFTGRVDGTLARMKMELTIDLLRDEWTRIPIGLGAVAVDGARFKQTPAKSVKPLLQLVKGRYSLLAQGKGRWILEIDFVRQLTTKPGLNELSFSIPRAAISTLQLEIPDSNVGVKITPMLAAATKNGEGKKKGTTTLQAFLGDAAKVSLTWKPKSKSDDALKPVIIAKQIQRVMVGEALINYDVTFAYEIHRKGVKRFDVTLPTDFRITGVTGEGIANWEVTPNAAKDLESLSVDLFSPVKGKYAFTVTMERFLQDATALVPIGACATTEVVRESGVIGVARVRRRSVEVVDAKKASPLMRVSTARLPSSARRLPHVTAYSFTTADYGYALKIGTVYPELEVRQRSDIGVGRRKLTLRQRNDLTVRKAAVFTTAFEFPEPWKVTRVEPRAIVDEYEVVTVDRRRLLKVSFKAEMTSDFHVTIIAETDRPATETVVVPVPVPDPLRLKRFEGVAVLHLHDSLRVEVLKRGGLNDEPLRRLGSDVNLSEMKAIMAFKRRELPGTTPLSIELKITNKPAQVSAEVHRVIRLTPGSISHEAVIEYEPLYAPVGEFYLKLDKRLADKELQIMGPDVKETPVVKAPDKSVMGADDPERWIYRKIVLQAPRTGTVMVFVQWRETFDVGQDGAEASVSVLPIAAAGKLTSQRGFVSVVKSPTLAIGDVEATDLVAGDPSSKEDLPYEQHRDHATLAFKSTSGNYDLTLPVRMQRDAEVFTTIVNAMVIQQVIGRDGTLNAKATIFISSSRGDRLPITLPAEAKFYSFYLDGKEVPVEATGENERVVRLPHGGRAVSRIRLEMTYKVDNANASKLPAPILPLEIPVQRTYWLVWIPKNNVLLAHDRDFSEAHGTSMWSLVDEIGNGHATNGMIAFPTQGRLWSFSKQGGARSFSITTLRRETFTLTLWVLALVAAVFLLRVNGFLRSVSVLGTASVLAVVGLFAPIFAYRTSTALLKIFPIIVILWCAHWLFVTRKRRLATGSEPSDEAELDSSADDAPLSEVTSTTDDDAKDDSSKTTSADTADDDGKED